jgi:hypothetical protein
MCVPYWLMPIGWEIPLWAPRLTVHGGWWRGISTKRNHRCECWKRKSHPI